MNTPRASHPSTLWVGDLPSYRFGHHSLMWWAIMATAAIEGTVFALALASYFYLRSNTPQWPPGALPPGLTWGTFNTFLLLASIVPNEWTKRAAERGDLAIVRVGMAVCLGFTALFLGIRVLEFQSLNVHWDSNAYGSITWTLLGLHTVHLVTEAVDSAVLTALMFSGPLEGRRFVDVSESGVYWNFVVLAWLPIYAVVYWIPRLG
jgi:heme/copper-type cytochrome/quinol oxidase subunit 3